MVYLPSFTKKKVNQMLVNNLYMDFLWYPPLASVIRSRHFYTHTHHSGRVLMIILWHRNLKMFGPTIRRLGCRSRDGSSWSKKSRFGRVKNHRKITWQLEKQTWMKMYFLRTMVIFHCHVSLLEGRLVGLPAPWGSPGLSSLHTKKNLPKNILI